tara:strand:- start:75 stop:257 length:183 start_codon:yes stop_codon:yes gene_type:complete
MSIDKKRYMVKVLTRDGKVYTISPLMTMEEAQKISRDLQLTDLTAWVTDAQEKKLTKLED